MLSQKVICIWDWKKLTFCIQETLEVLNMYFQLSSIAPQNWNLNLIIWLDIIINLQELQRTEKHLNTTMGI